MISVYNFCCTVFLCHWFPLSVSQWFCFHKTKWQTFQMSSFFHFRFPFSFLHYLCFTFIRIVLWICWISTNWLFFLRNISLCTFSWSFFPQFRSVFFLHFLLCLWSFWVRWFRSLSLCDRIRRWKTMFVRFSIPLWCVLSLGSNFMHRDSQIYNCFPIRRCSSFLCSFHCAQFQRSFLWFSIFCILLRKRKKN